jgi:hypothetical protein
MKQKLLLASVLMLAVCGTAMALSPLVITGKWAGPAFANPAFDLDADGNPARTFQVNTYDVTQLRFVALEGVVDTSLIALPGGAGNTCANPSLEFELMPIGNLIFRGHQDGALYATVDSSHHLCFNPTAPNETLYFNVTRGTGIYTGRTGTGTASLNDTPLIVAPGVGFPLFIDSRGSFAMTLN